MDDATPQPAVDPATVAQTRDEVRTAEQQAEDERREAGELRKRIIGSENGADYTATDMNILVDDIKRELLFHIIWNMKESKISLEEAQLLAHDFISLLPAADKEDLLNKLRSVGETYREAKEVYVKYAVPHEEAKRQQTLAQLAQHIQSGDIEQAISVAKGANQ